MDNRLLLFQSHFSHSSWDSRPWTIKEEEAFKRACEYLLQKYAYDGQKLAGNYLVAYKIEFARWLTYPEVGHLVWRDPKKENAHIGIVIHDGSDLHIIPGLVVDVSVFNEKGWLVGKNRHPYLYRPWMYHYGCNWILPGDGKYTLRVQIDRSSVEKSLQDAQPGRTLLPMVVEFKNVPIKTGHKLS